MLAISRRIASLERVIDDAHFGVSRGCVVAPLTYICHLLVNLVSSLLTYTPEM